MIEILNGLHETIVYGNAMGLKIYHNDESDDFPEHWHTGMEIIIPKISDYTAYIGGECYHLNPGDIFMINSGILHRLEAPPTGERIIMQFDVALLYSLKEMETLLSLFPPALMMPCNEEDEVYSCIYEKFIQIVDEYKRKDMFCEAAIQRFW